ncbi:MAG: ABC transporter ATP-binding protein [SAR202 cluster bacterium]|nr:ABC transporter ATP-binding protein [SAR202 cluster bacterium]MDP6513805.1 ABC transporter ATP-binding protein [SAR202 cluster bacterium]MDP6714720.1 ABC transporter ATP-binding protein [SAR202 cluster bacterium]
MRFSYNGIPVLSGFDFSAKSGEFVGLVGPNGTGKTTLIRLMSGVLKHDAGVVEILGSRLDQMKPTERARLVSVVPQNPRTPSGLTAWDLVLLGRNPHLRMLQWEGKSDAEIAHSAMVATSTHDLADREMDSLSGGERQRVLIAMALAQQCPVMLLDEPTSNLDIAHQPAIMELLTTLKSRDDGVVVVAMHDLTLAAQYCDRIVVIHEGRNFADGKPQDVLTEEIIQRVYGVQVRVLSHPDTGMPVIVGANSAAQSRRNGL